MESHIDKNITKSHVQEFIKGTVIIQSQSFIDSFGMEEKRTVHQHRASYDEFYIDFSRRIIKYLK